MQNLGILRYQSGATWLQKQEVAQDFIAKHRFDNEKWQELAELIRHDVGYEVDSEAVPASLEEWARTDAVTKRGMYAPWRSTTNNVLPKCLRETSCSKPAYVQASQDSRQRVVWPHRTMHVTQQRMDHIIGNLLCACSRSFADVQIGLPSASVMKGSCWSY